MRNIGLNRLASSWSRKITIGLMAIAAVSVQAQETNDFALDETPVDDGAVPYITSYADVLGPARQAVVSVTTASIVEYMRGGRGNSPIEEFLRRYYGIPEEPEQRGGGEEPQTFERRIPHGLGSGVIISDDGYILTNNHVVTTESGDPADEITVTLSDGSEVEAELIGRDARTDIALVKIDMEELPSLTMADSNLLNVGDVVFAIGNPLGVGQTSTMGIVSATGRSNLGLLGNQGYENFIQTDAAINQGNSGGALVDAKGRLIGINTAIFSQTGGNIGIGFAIPTRLIRNVVLELVEAGTVRRGYLGVSISDLNSDMAEAFGLEDDKGALIESVQDRSPAERAGLERGDIIREINGEAVDSVTDLRLTVAAIRPGTDVEVQVFRDGKKRKYTVTLSSLDDPTAVVVPEDSPLEGVAMEPVNDTNAEEWSLELDSGILITEVEARSPYAQVLSAGMVILEVNGVEVESVGDLVENIRERRPNRLWVSFRGNTGYVALRMRR
ncbi:MAG: Do family serine endopeptidase [Puniceicoccaceae bacterium]